MTGPAMEPVPLRVAPGARVITPDPVPLPLALLTLSVPAETSVAPE